MNLIEIRAEGLADSFDGPCCGRFPNLQFPCELVVLGEMVVQGR